MLSRKVVLGLVLASILFAGCGTFSSKGPDYKSQGGRIPSLEVPPDLTSPVADDRFLIPDAKATTYSAYNKERGAAPASGSAVLPKVENVRVERSGNQRWLVVRATPDKVWPLVRDFWIEAGFIMKRELPEAGIMETDWAEDRSKLPQDFVRNAIGKVLDGLYETGFRDKFRTRLEPGTEAGTTEVYLSHRGLEEVFSNPDKASTVWQARPADRELEAEMLARMVAKLGFAPPDKAAAGSAGVGDTAVVRASYDKMKGGPLTVTEPFDRSWRRVGLALDRIGFTVEDRDRSKGVFFVRYIDPDADAKKGSDKGWLDKLAFWRKDDPAAKPQYRIVVTEIGGNSRVVVQTADAKNDDSATAKRILSLLLEQLK
jgi:outer membrane protein assembly factor BamC